MDEDRLPSSNEIPGAKLRMTANAIIESWGQRMGFLLSSRRGAGMRRVRGRLGRVARRGEEHKIAQVRLGWRETPLLGINLEGFVPVPRAWSSQGVVPIYPRFE